MRTGFEDGDLQVVRVLLWFGGLAVAVAVAFSIADVVWLEFSTRRGAPDVTANRPVFAELDPSVPRLQIDEQGDLKAMREAEEDQLATYGWIDRRAGIVRIPIDRAMALLVERGLATERRR